MKHIAAPMVGGLLSSTFLKLEIIPAVYTYWRLSQIKHEKKTQLPLSQPKGWHAQVPISCYLREGGGPRFFYSVGGSRPHLLL